MTRRRAPATDGYGLICAAVAHAAAAKAGVDSLTRTLAAEWGCYGIRINGVAPGPTAGTEGVQRLTSSASLEAAVKQCPLGRLASIDDVANAVLFLCSGAAAFVNGVTLVVDGGLWLRTDRIASSLVAPVVEAPPPQ